MEKRLLMVRLALAASLIGVFVAQPSRAAHNPSTCASFTDQPDRAYTYLGGENCDIIYMLNKNDDAYGLGGPDDLHMGDGNDYADGASGTDYIYGGANGTSDGWDWLYGAGNNDFIYDREGPDSTDVLCGKAGDDWLQTGDGDSADRLYGGDGFDTTDDGGDGDVKSGEDHASWCV